MAGCGCPEQTRGRRPFQFMLLADGATSRYFASQREQLDELAA